MQRYILIIILCRLITLSPYLYAFQSDIKEKVIDFIIKDLANSVQANEAGISYLEGDFDLNGKNDLVLLVIMEGIGSSGYDYGQYLILISNYQDKKFSTMHMFVGGKDNRTLSFNSFKEGVLTFDSKFVQESDPLCCPSGRGQAYFTIHDEILIDHTSLLDALVSRRLIFWNSIRNQENRDEQDQSVTEKLYCIINSMLPFNTSMTYRFILKGIQKQWPNVTSTELMRFWFHSLSLDEQIKVWEIIEKAIIEASKIKWLNGEKCLTKPYTEYFLLPEL